MSSKKNVVVRGGEVKVYAANFSKPHPTMEGKRGKREVMDKIIAVNYDLSKTGKKTYRVKGQARNKKEDGTPVGMSVQVSEEDAKKVADMLGMKITKSKVNSSKPARKVKAKTQKKNHCKKVGEEAKEKCLKEHKVNGKKKGDKNGSAKKSPSKNGSAKKSPSKNGSAKKSSSKRGPGRPKKSSS